MKAAEGERRRLPQARRPRQFARDVPDRKIAVFEDGRRDPYLSVGGNFNIELHARKAEHTKCQRVEGLIVACGDCFRFQIGVRSLEFGETLVECAKADSEDTGCFPMRA